MEHRDHRGTLHLKKKKETNAAYLQTHKLVSETVTLLDATRVVHHERAKTEVVRVASLGAVAQRKDVGELLIDTI